MPNFVRKLIDDAIAAGHTITCAYDGDVDYRGQDGALAEEAARACDEMQLSISNGGGEIVGTVLIVSGLDPEEEIADLSGAWTEAWWEKNVHV